METLRGNDEDDDDDHDGRDYSDDKHLKRHLVDGPTISTKATTSSTTTSTTPTIGFEL